MTPHSPNHNDHASAGPAPFWRQLLAEHIASGARDMLGAVLARTQGSAPIESEGEFLRGEHLRFAMIVADALEDAPCMESRQALETFFALVERRPPPTDPHERELARLGHCALSHLFAVPLGDALAARCRPHKHTPRPCADYAFELTKGAVEAWLGWIEEGRKDETRTRLDRLWIECRAERLRAYLSEKDDHARPYWARFLLSRLLLVATLDAALRPERNGERLARFYDGIDAAISSPQTNELDLALRATRRLLEQRLNISIPAFEQQRREHPGAKRAARPGSASSLSAVENGL